MGVSLVRKSLRIQNMILHLLVSWVHSTSTIQVHREKSKRGGNRECPLLGKASAAKTVYVFQYNSCGVIKSSGGGRSVVSHVHQRASLHNIFL